MKQVLAIGDGADPDSDVRAAAEAIADITDASVQPVLVNPEWPQARQAETILAQLAELPTLLGVLRVVPAAQAACWRVIAESSKPLVVIPPGALHRDRALERVLLPLDGDLKTTSEMNELLTARPLEIIVLHVFDRDRVPKYWDQAAHAYDAWGEEFLARHAPPGATLRLRRGGAGDNIVAVAEEEDVDLIALGWSQRLQPGRAHTVRRTLLEATVPVLLAPLR